MQHDEYLLHRIVGGGFDDAETPHDSPYEVVVRPKDVFNPGQLAHALDLPPARAFTVPRSLMPQRRPIRDLP
jgi:hypothetical protein